MTISRRESTKLRTLLVLTASAWGSTLDAQNLQAASIPAFENAEAPDTAWQFGSLANGRVQLVEGAFRGTPKLLTEICLRVEGAPFQPFPAAFERSWQNVELRLAEGNFAEFGRELDTNNITAWTLVRSGPMTWNEIDQNPNPGSPRPWGSHVRFVLSQPWSYTGTLDLLMDFRFEGGSMPRIREWPRLVIPYALEAEGAGGTAIASLQHASTKVCPEAGGIFLDVHVYAQGPTPVALAGGMTIDGGPAGLPPNAPVVTVFATGGNGFGTDLGLCHRLFLDFTVPSIAIVGVADASGNAINRFPVIPWGPSLVGTQLWTQALFLDAAQRPVLTNGGFATIPSRQTNPHRRAASWAVDPAGPIGSPPDPRADSCPLLLIKYQ